MNDLLGAGVIAGEGVEGGGGPRLLLDALVIIVVPVRHGQVINIGKV